MAWLPLHIFVIPFAMQKMWKLVYVSSVEHRDGVDGFACPRTVRKVPESAQFFASLIRFLIIFPYIMS
jgi:hypothetical protein